MNALKGVATIFIVGNEPNLEPEAGDNHGITSTQYADAFNSLYGDTSKVVDVMYLAAGPSAFAQSNPVVGAGEVDETWLANASSRITGLDGWALHTYGSPYLPYAHDYGVNQDCLALCSDPTKECSFECHDHNERQVLFGDASFRRYRQFMDAISPKWASKPVYFTGD